jgi:hypothetical protein
VFDMGQRGYGEPGGAVGRDGMPAVDRWNSRQETQLEHDEYWRNDRVAQLIAASLRSAPIPLAEIDLSADELGSVEIAEPMTLRALELETRLLSRSWNLFHPSISWA